MNAYTDIARVLTACQDGDSEAIDALVRAYKPHVYRFALSILRDPVDAEEATQDSLIAAIDKLDTYRRESSFKTWLFAITLNTCRGRLRKRKVREKLQRPLAVLFGRISQESDHPEQIILRNETQAAVWRAINMLHEQHREILILRYYHELSLNDIARIVGLSDRTIRTRLHTAHERLRVLLREEAGSR
jgi:RNA polymerase sigma-70 factor (ECF subfamily)